MGTRIPETEKPVIYLIVGYIQYEESISLAASLSLEAAQAWRDQYELDHPDHWFDTISIDQIELI